MLIWLFSLKKENVNNLFIIASRQVVLSFLKEIIASGT